MTTRVRIKTKSGECLAEAYREDYWASNWLMINGRGFSSELLTMVNLIIEPIEEPKPKRALAYRRPSGAIEWFDDGCPFEGYRRAPEYDIVPRGGER